MRGRIGQQMSELIDVLVVGAIANGSMKLFLAHPPTDLRHVHDSSAVQKPRLIHVRPRTVADVFYQVAFRSISPRLPILQHCIS